VHKHLGRLRYGGRKSAKLVRCYRKKSKNAYRVEVELHSSLLNQHGMCGMQIAMLAKDMPLELTVEGRHK
jgi:hypothetical protein